MYHVADERFWEKVEKTESCWLWTAGQRRGYGAFWHNGISQYAHRVAWELLVGAIPDNLVVDHDNPEYGCGNSLCVRPDHLDLVTYVVNLQRKRKLRSDNTSGYRGVIRYPTGWRARVVRDGVIHTRGPYATAEEANAAAIELRDPFLTIL